MAAINIFKILFNCFTHFPNFFFQIAMLILAKLRTLPTINLKQMRHMFLHPSNTALPLNLSVSLSRTKRTFFTCKMISKIIYYLQ